MLQEEEVQQQQRGVKRFRDHPSCTQDGDDWLEARKQYMLTGSEFGAAMGFGKYCSRKLLYKRKKGILPVVNDKGNELSFDLQITQWGKDMEHVAREVLEKELRQIYKAPNLTIRETGIHAIERVLDGDTPWYGASPDGLITSPYPYKPCTVEIKCPFSQKVYKELTEFDPDIGPRLCLDYYIQVQAQMRAVGSKLSFFCCWTPQEYVILLVQRNDAFIEKMLNLLDHFVTCYLVKNVEPPRFVWKKKVEQELNSLIPNNSITLLKRVFVE